MEPIPVKIKITTEYKIEMFFYVPYYRNLQKGVLLGKSNSFGVVVITP